MKASIFLQIKSGKSFLIPSFLTMLLAFSIVILPSISQAQQNSLSLADILIGLRSKKAPLPEKNELLTDAVKTRGITFALTGEIEKELGTTGASLALIAAIRERSPAIKASPVVVSTPVPTPKPVSSAPDYAFYQNQGNAFFVKGNYDLAVVNYNKGIELNPKDATNYLSRGLAYYNKNFYDLAVADYTKAIEITPQESTIYFKRGDSYEKLGDKDKAIADYQKAIELDKDNEAAKTYLQRLLAEKAKNTPKPQVAEAAKETTPAVEKTTAPRSINRGSLNDLAIKLVVPFYPQIERQRNVSGLVTVQISLDEEGKVLSAKALDGPRSLRSFAEEAAEKSKFKPATVDNKPAAVSGFITYNFKIK